MIIKYIVDYDLYLKLFSFYLTAIAIANLFK